MSSVQIDNGECTESTTGRILGIVDTLRKSQGPSMFLEKERTKITDTYWPNLKKALLEDLSVRDCLDLECAICYDRITIHDEDHTTEHLDIVGETTHEPCVLPCGHVLGLSCLKKMSINDLEERKASQCPCCRFSLHHQGCTHHVAKTAIFWSDLDKMRLTIPEGGELKTDCMECTLDSLGQGLAELVELLHPGSSDTTTKVGVRISDTSCRALADFQHSFTTSGVPFEASPNTPPFNPFQGFFNESLEILRSANQNAWTFTDPKCIKIDLALYQRTYEGDQECEDDEDDRDEWERENDASRFYFTPLMQEDMRG